VVVNNLHIFRVAVFPLKAEAPLVINPDRVLTSTVASQPLKPISRRRPQIIQTHRRVYKGQFVLSPANKILRKAERPSAIINRVG